MEFPSLIDFMVNPQITVIVPIYNAESYLRDCLNSILNQTFFDFEAILVNDGSTDNSLSIIKEYSQKDERFRYVDKQNEGVSATRQRGLEEARGEFVIHCDSDDIVSPSWLKELHNAITKSSADMAICDFERIYKNQKMVFIQRPAQLVSAQIAIDIINGKIWGVCWNKLIRLSCIRNNGISFNPNMRLNEDSLFNCLLLLKNIKVVYVSEILYYYQSFVNKNSILNKPTIKDIESQIQFIDIIQEELQKTNIEDELLIPKVKVKRLIFNVLKRNTKLLRDSYKEINGQFIKASKNCVFWSEPYCISLCLKGFPWWIGHGIRFFIAPIIESIISFKNRILHIPRI